MPDVIVHTRGRDGPNLVAIEAKTRRSDRSPDNDEKLRDYVTRHRYAFTFFVAFDPGFVDLVRSRSEP